MSSVIQQPPVFHAGAVVPLEIGNSMFPAFRLETSAEDGGYAVSYELCVPVAGNGTRFRIVVDLEVESGAIGIGCMNESVAAFVDVEQTIPAGPRRKVYVGTGAAGTARRLMLRNASHDGASAARVHEIELREVDADEERRASVQSSLWDVPLAASAEFHRSGGDADAAQQALANIGAATGTDLQSVTFPIAVTHTSRVWDWQRCTREFLYERYHRPGRLDELPSFAELPPSQEARSFSGRLTLFNLTINGSGIWLAPIRCIDSQHKIQHASEVGDSLVVCLEDYLIVLADERSPQKSTEHRLQRIDDPWFAGLHTVFPVDQQRCIVSASAPDAILLVNLAESRVEWRWRVPADRYGRNYELNEATSVQDHHIANDIQLAHLNSAFPDGSGGFWISTLGQGDIAHLSAHGRYDVIASGFVGCHGLRYSRERECLYFSDSCTGRLIEIGADRDCKTVGAVDSRWLHDAQHLAGDIFLLCLGDKNAIVLIDASSNNEIARFDMKPRGENVQFVSLIGEPAYQSMGAVDRLPTHAGSES